MNLIDINKSDKEYRKFGAAVGFALALVGSLMLWHDKLVGTTVFYTLSAVTFILLIFFPGTMKYPYLFFMGIGWVNTRIILILTFYGIVTPMGFFLRVIGKDPLDKKWKVDKSTYWLERNQQPISPGHVEKPF